MKTEELDRLRALADRMAAPHYSGGDMSQPEVSGYESGYANASESCADALRDLLDELLEEEDG